MSVSAVSLGTMVTCAQRDHFKREAKSWLSGPARPQRQDVVATPGHRISQMRTGGAGVR